MKIKALALAALSGLLVCAHTPAAAAKDKRGCVKKSLVVFLSGGKAVPSEVIAGEDRYDLNCSFGGNNVRTPKNRIRVFVNFNIPGTVNLDAIDSAFDRLAAGKPQGFWMQDEGQDFAVVFVKDSWMKGRFDNPWHGAAINSGRSGLYITERSLRVEPLAAIYEHFFGSEEIWRGTESRRRRPRPSEMRQAHIPAALNMARVMLEEIP